MTAAEYITSENRQLFRGGDIGGDAWRLAVNPHKLDVQLAAGVQARLAVIYTEPCQSSVTIHVGKGASLDLYELYLSEAFAAVEVECLEQAHARLTTALLGSANTDYTIRLTGRGADLAMQGVFVTGGTEHAVTAVTVRHEAVECKSMSSVRGVASGRSTGEFHGLVYVAPDAQRTDAQQQSRNLLLGDDAHIVTRPQLEIYADDVRCTHGAAVGQLDAEAVMYMRQRGLSERDARRLQVEGFVSGLAAEVEDEVLREVMVQECAAKIDKL